ncbi:translesion DNA synthesis-associated protein ImuA [Variovorax boronicumulans]|uniref:translesion DNA synthesis-associated protein ImuA n=1 Tax=Variovorax boronicumulans TaxID=436515 RepID=UPI001C578F52
MGLPSISSSFVSARHNVWRGDELGVADLPVLGTGHAVLDAELPGGGWPVGAMTELLQARPEAHVWALLLPALARAVAERGGPVMLIGAPYEPFGPALAAGGLPSAALMWVRGQSSAECTWACEQALRCADVAAVLAWLPQARASELRRLQLAAAQHEGLLFVMRPEAVAQSASPARLRLQLGSAEDGRMEVHLLKRRGPPLAQPLSLPARNARLAALLAASLRRRQGADRAKVEVDIPAAKGATVVRLDLRRRREEGSHAVDRLALVG